MQNDNRSVAASMLRKGDRVVHCEHGAGTVVRVRKSDSAVILKMDADSIIGTVSAEMLSWERRDPPKLRCICGFPGGRDRCLAHDEGPMAELRQRVEADPTPERRHKAQGSGLSSRVRKNRVRIGMSELP